jgi:PAS domain S-box-containing protein
LIIESQRMTQARSPVRIGCGLRVDIETPRHVEQSSVPSGRACRSSPPAKDEFMAEPQQSSEGELLRLAVELSPSGMVAVDSTGAILLVNREVERMFGYSREELLGRSVDMLVPMRLGAEHPTYRAHFFGRPESRPMGMGRDLYGVRKDGREVPVEIGLNPVPTPNGVVVLASVVDITARRKLDEQLRQSQKMEAIGTLAGGIAHDFNNILLGIIGHTELAMGTGGSPSQQRADLEQVLKSAERGRQLVQRILLFSRQRGTAQGPVNLERTVRDALQLLRPSLPTTIEIKEWLDPNTPEVLSDETQVHQILMNLATNAAHAMPEGGTLEVRLEAFTVNAAFTAAHPEARPGLHARLSVADTGSGMPREIASRVFEPFFTTKAPGVGTGLGLSVVHGLVQEHRGVIEIQSEVGKGTRIDIYLPASSTIADATPKSGDEPPARRKHILLVEDEEALALMLKRQVTALGYQVTVHTSSVAALEDFTKRPDAFQLLLTDNTMPRMTGLTLAQHILDARPDLPVLLVSGLAETANPQTLYDRGIRKLLAKPHTGRELAEAIRELIGPA